MSETYCYRGDELYCEGVKLKELAQQYGTPLYVYSASHLESQFRAFSESLSTLNHLVCYSVKANSNLAVLKLLFSLGAGADIVSGGELERVLRAGGDPGKVVFSGVGKTDEEMRFALEKGILAFNVESEQELEVLSEVAVRMGKQAPVSMRVNPDVDPETHPYISTGLKKNKFGIPWTAAPEVYRRAKELPGIKTVGIDCHIGSQLTKTEPFADAIARLVDLIDTLSKDGIEISCVDIGGGLGISYGEEGESQPPTPAEYGETVRNALEPLSSRNIRLLCEPGRVIAGNAGALITKVLYRKRSEIKEFVVVDAAFNDLLRPAFYGSFHPMKPVSLVDGRGEISADIVGPICETGDFLARDRKIQELERGDLVWIGSAGAYGFTMASNYNTRPRAAEVLVEKDSHRLVRRRENLDELLQAEEL